MQNRDYARILNEIATLQRIAGDNHFKVRAFERAARMIEDLPEQLDDLLDRHEVDVMQGIGESIETELQALRTTGHSPRHEELLARIGPGVMDLMDIQGLGMRRMQILFQEAGIASIAELKQAALAGELRELPAFGEAIEEKLLGEIEHWEHTRGKRYPLPEAKGLADSIRYQLLQLEEVDRAEVGGSIRRGRETIGDIDILVTTSDPRLVADYFKSLPEVVEVIFDGDSRASVRVIGGIQVDLRNLDRNLFGAGLHYFTGSKEHHIQMRLRSKKMGLKISEHGVMRYDDPTETPVGPMDTEEQVFEAVGMCYVPPEIRMGKDEIALAEQRTIPELIHSRHLRGETHVCSSRSGGRDEVMRLLERAAELGYEWLAITERSRGVDPRKGLDNAAVQDWLSADLDLEGSPVRLLRGVEVEITPQGMLDIDHRLLAHADWVVAGLHHDISEDPDENTQRIIWGIESGVVSCLGAPTGRRLGHHEGHPMYFEEVIEACNDFGVALEMSGHPNKFDLSAPNAARALTLGAMLVVSADASSAATLSHVDYATQQARRAWIEPHQVLNTLSADDILSRVRNLVH